MARTITIEEQIQDSMRGPRIYGEFPSISEPKWTIGEIPRVQSFYGRQAIRSLEVPAGLGEWELVPSVHEEAFDLSLQDFLSLELGVAEEMLRRVSRLCRGLLEEAWGRGIQQVVICEGEIISESRDVDGIPSETVEKLARGRNKACYVFSAPDVIEESAWTSIDNNDYYPTLPVHLGTEDSDEKEILETNPINADLDTGNPSYKIFDANELTAPLTSFTPSEMRMAEHLKQEYTYYSKTAKICVKDISGNVSSMVCTIRVVRDWKGCALLQASPNRKGFIGRDALRALRIRLKLDPLEKTTQILDVMS